MSASYTTATAFRQALEARLNDLARREGVDIQRLRRQVAFDRLLCRLFYEPTAPWILKGGYAMELRLAKSRTTRDIDLGARSPIPGAGRLPERILKLLQTAAALDMDDFFYYAIGRPIKDLAGAPYGGARYPVAARMDGRVFAQFHLDVAGGDPMLEPLENVQGRDWLGFAGITARRFPAVSREQQFAEKLHAYTLPRIGGINARVRDLVDMYLLFRLGLDPQRARAAIHAIFNRRKTHKTSYSLPTPPVDWTRPFAALAKECSVDTDIRAAFQAIASFVAGLK